MHTIYKFFGCILFYERSGKKRRDGNACVWHAREHVCALPFSTVTIMDAVFARRAAVEAMAVAAGGGDRRQQQRQQQ